MPQQRPSRKPETHLQTRAVVQAEDGSHEVRQRVVAEVRGDVAHAQALAGRQRRRRRVRQRRRPQPRRGERTELCILDADRLQRRMVLGTNDVRGKVRGIDLVPETDTGGGVQSIQDALPLGVHTAQCVEKSVRPVAPL